MYFIGCLRRKKLAGNSPSVTMRVPQYIRREIQALIDMYAHWCASDEEPLLVSKTNVEQRLKTIEFLHYVTEHEKEYISMYEIKQGKLRDEGIKYVL